MNEHKTRVQRGGEEVAKKCNKIWNLNISFHSQMFPKSQCLNNHFLVINSQEF